MSFDFHMKITALVAADVIVLIEYLCILQMHDRFLWHRSKNNGWKDDIPDNS